MERLTCPCCGFPVAAGDKECPAGHPLYITSFHSLSAMTAPQVNKYVGTFRRDLATNPEDHGLNESVGICFLKLKLYDKAREALEKTLVDNYDDSEAFFYAAVSLLGGKKPFLHTHDEIDKIEAYLNAALMIEEKGIYYYFLAYIRRDYYERKYLKPGLDSRQTLQLALNSGVTEADKVILFDMLNMERPNGM